MRNEKESERNLTAQQDLFCREWIFDFNGTKAAIRAGYSEKTARIKASQLLSKVNIQERIRELQESQNKPIEQRYIISRELILDKLAKHVIANIKDPSGDESNRDYNLNVYNSLSRNQLKAIEVINKMMGYDMPKVEKQSDVNVSIEFIDSPALDRIEGFDDVDTDTE